MATHSVFLPEESYEQRNLAGYSPWGCTQTDMTEVTLVRAHTHTRKLLSSSVL